MAGEQTKGECAARGYFATGAGLSGEVTLLVENAEGLHVELMPGGHVLELRADVAEGLRKGREGGGKRAEGVDQGRRRMGVAGNKESASVRGRRCGYTQEEHWSNGVGQSRLQPAQNIH